MSANFLTLALWIGSLIVNCIGWWLATRRKTDREILRRLSYMEKSNKRVLGWIFGKFEVDLNGDD